MKILVRGLRAVLAIGALAGAGGCGTEVVTSPRLVRPAERQMRGPELPYFTNREVLEAFQAVMPSQVEAVREALGPDLDAQARVGITDKFYLVLAALSSDYADRIVRCRPDLAAEIAGVRRDPAGYLAERRAADEAEGEPER